MLRPYKGVTPRVDPGAKVDPGAQVPPRLLVPGGPGRVKRLLTDAEVASMLADSERYVNYRLDYMTA